MNLKDGALLSFKVDGRELRLPLKVIDELADGLLGLPAGFDGIPPLVGDLFAEALQEVAQ
ncbi:NADH-quinone oxidoreductase subunit G [compost metagenome]